MYISIAIFLLVLVLPLSAAEVYKSVDQHGNTVFSDVPSDKAEKIDVGEVPTIPAIKQQTPRAALAEPVKRYRTLVVTNPVHDQTYFRSEGDLIVSVKLEPQLETGDKIVIYLNSNEFVSGESSTYSIKELDRGTYQLRVAIKDAQDKIAISSGTVTFHMRQNAIQNPQNAPRPAIP